MRNIYWTIVILDESMKIHWRWSKSGFRRLSIELFQKMFHFGVLEPFYDDLGKHDMKSLVRLYTKELRNNLAEALFTNSCMYVFYLRWQLMWKPISYMLPSLTVCRSENVFHFPFFLFSFGPQNYENINYTSNWGVMTITVLIWRKL